MVRKISIITGSRAEYGLLKPVMKAIEAKEGLKLSVIACGMHLRPEFGYTVSEIKRDGFSIEAELSERGDDLAASFGQSLIGLSEAIAKIKPDLILVLGDRFEALAGAVAGAVRNIPIAHIHGGDKTDSGHIDESIRQAITSFAHLHFAATRQSANRIKQMGEEGWRIHQVGSPALDAILQSPFASEVEVAQTLGLDLNKPIIVVLQHPVSLEYEQAGWQMEQTMAALKQFNAQTVVIYPNSDPGYEQMIKVIENYQSRFNLQIHKSIPHSLYLGLLKTASALVGNSSSGIIEAPSFGLPAVNIGSRNRGRQHAENLILVDYNIQEILKAVKRVIEDKDFKAKARQCINPYGDGYAGQRIAAILAEIPIDKRLLHKLRIDFQ